MSANAACETQIWCHQIKVITVKRSKLTIKFYKIVVDLQEFVVIKVLFKAISGKFISKLLFLFKKSMIWLILAIYSMPGTRCGAQSIDECMNKNLKCLITWSAQRASEVLLTLCEGFFKWLWNPLMVLHETLSQEQNFLGNILAQKIWGQNLLRMRKHAFIDRRWNLQMRISA